MRAWLIPALLACLLHCGGARPSPPAATALSYGNPAAPTQWRFVQDAGSTRTHLVLDLLAPPVASGMGVTFVLSVDGSRAAWSSAGPGPVAPLAYGGPLVHRASIRGSDLRVVVSQENPTPPVKYGTAPVLSVALDLAPAGGPGTVALTASQGGHLAAPLAQPEPIAVDVGTLQAQ